MIPIFCLIIAISDGDTLSARCGSETIKVRLAQIDAPEKAQPFGNRSKQSLSDLCFKVQAEIRPEKKDRYGRTVARVACNGIDASTHQVSTGMAWVYQKYSTDPALPTLEQKSRMTRVGLWADEKPVAPWEFRRSPSVKAITAFSRNHPRATR